MRKRRLWITLGFLILAGALVYGIGVATTSPRPEQPFFERDRPLVIAHQGGDGLRPSNTMAAFTHADGLGVDVLEMDIHATKDGVLVVIHDDTVDRTTDGTGPVLDYTFADLQTLDAGYHWPTLEITRAELAAAGADPYPFRGQGIEIPALEEILQTFPDKRLNIEIKQKEPSITQDLCDLLDRYGMQPQTLVASFHPETIEEFRTICPNVSTSGVEPEIRRFYILNRLFLGPIYRPVTDAFQVPQRFGNLVVITPRFVRVAQRHNIDVHVWTINTGAEMADLLDVGVDGIITDYPDLLIEEIETRE